MMARFSARKLLGALTLGIGIALAPGAQAAPYSGMYVFGDSLSDMGNVYAATGHAVPPFPYYDGRFSNGPTYAEDLAGKLSLSLSPSVFGGNNYAWGGATAGPGSAASVPSLGDQVAAYRALPGGADAGALYVLWAGGNDLRANPSAAGITAALGGLSSAVQGLYAEGARSFLVLNLPNLGLTPESRVNGVSAAATAGSATFNAYFNGVVGGLQANLAGSSIRTLDTFALISGIVANPGASGLANVTDACLGVSTICANPDKYLFWDSIHPTAAGHRLIADAAFNVLAVPEPETYALLLAGMGLIAVRARRRS